MPRHVTVQLQINYKVSKRHHRYTSNNDTAGTQKQQQTLESKDKKKHKPEKARLAVTGGTETGLPADKTKRGKVDGNEKKRKAV